jgi:hypothetical protein
VPVSLRALIQRINRKLATDQGALYADQLRKARGLRWRQTVGEYYLLNVFRNAVDNTRVDPETLGRELGVLAPWEIVEEIEVMEKVG